jgi:hypothetical protein
MPLEILGPLVVFGILGIALLLHFTGHSQHRILANPADIAAEWARHFPASTPETIATDDDGKTALLTTPHGVGLLWLIGADTTARLLSAPPEIHDRPIGLIINLPDFAAPKVHATLRDAADRMIWTQILTGQHP